MISLTFLSKPCSSSYAGVKTDSIFYTAPPNLIPFTLFRVYNMRRKQAVEEEELIMLAVFLLASSVFFASTYGFYGSNTGSHYALVRAVVENQSFKVNSFVRYTGLIDYAVYEDNAYSDRAPGLAFAAAPFYLTGKLASSVLPLAAYYRGWDPGNPAGFTTLLLPVIAGGLSVALLYRICRELGGSVYASLITAFTLAFATIFWKHSTMFFSHVLSAFLLLLGLCLALTLKSLKKQRSHACAMFFALGYMVVVEYANILLTAIVVSYLFASRKMTVKDVTSMKKEILHPILCLIVPLLIIPFYNSINFGDPMTTAYKYSPHHGWVGDLGEALSTPLSEGVPGLLFTGEQVNGGLFLVSPILLLSIWGLKYMYRSRKPESMLVAALFLAHLLFYGKYKTWGGGGISDTRYLITVTPIIVLPLYAWVDGFLLKRKHEFEKAFYTLPLLVLFGMSVVNVMGDIATEEGHGTREFIFPAVKAGEISMLFDNVFGNIGRLPAYLGIVAILYSLASLALKRTVGIAYVMGEDQNFVAIVLGLAVAGFIAAIAFSGTSSVPAELKGWSYSLDGFHWSKVEPPYGFEGGGRLFVKGVLDVPGPSSNSVIGVMAEDCVSKVYVNDRLVSEVSNCTACMHCDGVRMDLGPLVQPGLNPIWFEVTGSGEAVKFTAQKLE
ncbi:MAG: hypothetical protein GF416_08185 [Candidatus Altiarchaeales archaeon]|nr:hypothetical protein [Candidatus Altiarchaeales archaeon]MBD3417093.1 hypothetical protein [Candidatus Altiarchaeales archaeon]